jgi:hypothetical protein
LILLGGLGACCAHQSSTASKGISSTGWPSRHHTTVRTDALRATEIKWNKCFPPAASCKAPSRSSQAIRAVTSANWSRPTPWIGHLSFYLTGDPRPFARTGLLEGIKGEGVSTPGGVGREKLEHDQRVHVIPAAKVIVTIPQTNDRLLVYRFDVEQALEKSALDYLMVTSQPLLSAKKGTTYSYQVTAKAKKGGVKYRLEAGPQGMTIDANGKLTWPVPADFAEAESDIIITVADGGGQEVFHTFRLAVRK